MYKLILFVLFVINNNSYDNIDYDKNIDYENFYYYNNIFSNADFFILYINKLLMDKMNYLKKIKKYNVFEYIKNKNLSNKIITVPHYVLNKNLNTKCFNIKKNNIIKNNIIKNNTINFLKLKILLSVQYFY